MAEYYAAWLLISEVASRSVSAVSITLYYLVYPILQLFRALALLLRPIWGLLRFVLLPLTYAANAIITLALLPFRLRLLAHLEIIYIYLGIAALIGCLTGAILYLSFNSLSSTLGIDVAAEPGSPEPGSREEEPAGRTVAEYRSATAKRRAKAEDSPYHPIRADPRLSRRRGGTRDDVERIDEDEDSL